MLGNTHPGIQLKLMATPLHRCASPGLLPPYLLSRRSRLGSASNRVRRDCPAQTAVCFSGSKDAHKGRVYGELLRQVMLQEGVLLDGRAGILAEGRWGDVPPALQDHCPGIACRASPLHPKPQLRVDPEQPTLPE